MNVVSTLLRAYCQGSIAAADFSCELMLQCASDVSPIEEASASLIPFPSSRKYLQANMRVGLCDPNAIIEHASLVVETGLRRTCGMIARASPYPSLASFFLFFASGWVYVHSAELIMRRSPLPDDSQPPEPHGWL